MNKQQRIELLNRQSRAFTSGIVENINDQWVFFNDENDEAFPLEEYIDREIEIHRGNRWKKGFLSDVGVVTLNRETLYLLNQEKVRIKKDLLYSFDSLLEELNDDSFFQFIMTLNSLSFSIHDCIYGYNQLTFLNDKKNCSGVNFFTFDNDQCICAVQHHFVYSTKEHDRFEFTLNTGKRIVIEKFCPK
ncbi:DUF2777 domain-containing protein [Bacillus massiliigorillae]|uniref:DUF2777 domain-containing protein n=1 Tax=Bacillus massiliigorillae TaxID=1243664 RepID=UPI00039EB837|nr:DUF2777 domain-containing protein [Bacillus massiliigorillae]